MLAPRICVNVHAGEDSGNPSWVISSEMYVFLPTELIRVNFRNHWEHMVWDHDFLLHHNFYSCVVQTMSELFKAKSITLRHTTFLLCLSLMQENSWKDLVEWKKSLCSTRVHMFWWMLCCFKNILHLRVGIGCRVDAAWVSTYLVGVPGFTFQLHFRFQLPAVARDRRQ